MPPAGREHRADRNFSDRRQRDPKRSIWHGPYGNIRWREFMSSLMKSVLLAGVAAIALGGPGVAFAGQAGSPCVAAVPGAQVIAGPGQTAALRTEGNSTVAAMPTPENQKVAAQRTQENSTVAAMPTPENQKVAAQRTQENSTVAAMPTPENQKVAAQRTQENSTVAAMPTPENQKVAAQRTQENSTVAALRTQENSKVAALPTQENQTVSKVA